MGNVHYWFVIAVREDIAQEGTEELDEELDEEQDTHAPSPPPEDDQDNIPVVPVSTYSDIVYSFATIEVKF